MASPVLSALAILPVAWLLTNILYGWSIWRNRFLVGDARAPRKLASTARQECQYVLSYSGLVVAGVVLWARSHAVTPREMGLVTDSWFVQVLVGAMAGMASLSWLLLARRLFRVGRPLHLVLPAFHSPRALMVVLWVSAALAEELWRALCLVAILSAGYGASFALIAVSVVSVISLSSRQLEVLMLGGINSAVYGALFLWQRSLMAPVAAHLAVDQAILTLFTLANDLGVQERAGTQCPFCGSKMSASAVDMWNPFPCPTCRELVQVSRLYRFVARLPMLVGIFGAVLMFTITGFTESVFRVCLAYAIWFGASMVFAGMALNFVPPKLKPGTPTFPSLNLFETGHPPSKNRSEHVESGATSPSKEQRPRRQ